MKKLVFEFYSGNKMICFEYKSKEDFISDTLERYNKYYRNKDEDYVSFEIFEGIYLGKNEADNIEYSVYLLDEWWDKNKKVA